MTKHVVVTKTIDIAKMLERMVDIMNMKRQTVRESLQIILPIHVETQSMLMLVSQKVIPAEVMLISRKSDTSKLVAAIILTMSKH
jgi:Ni2+-binding GTPase involved in maturation of urease and hydrogenase